MNIALVTTNRADYGLLFPLITRLKKEEAFSVRLIVTGAHLLERFGHTIDSIFADGMEVSDTVGLELADDSEDSICRAIASGLDGFSALFHRIEPDLLIVLGDRYELLSVCIAALIHKIPIAHIHGGESTQGAIDDSIRHSITKMSTLHFAAIEAYARRIVQMGEDPRRVYVVGALGIDNIKNLPLMDAGELAEISGVDFMANEVALLTYHPVTLDDYHRAEEQIVEVLEALLTTRLFVLVTMPNTDPGGYSIFQTLQDYVEKNPNRLHLVKNLGQRSYLTAMKFARLMIGNSSSGIIESASFQLPVVNIGDRQGGRFKPANVIDCACEKDAITNAIHKALSDEFMLGISSLENPYGDGHASERIVDILKSFTSGDLIKMLKKDFYDISSPD